ncbi:MAG: mechanosensitive ion channel, partial [Mucilaginibacter polytrichastri]|nr:mechanosensitive ion channel [Mucilaginibacter polytrichastri]
LIMPEPVPFIFQKSLDDFYISYELNAYTREANKQAAIYSELNGHILDVCHEQGIEVMSPHFHAMRDGSRLNIPNENLPKNYEPPAFGVKVDDVTNRKD